MKTADILEITNSQYVIWHEPDPFCFENADVNGDGGTINVLDIVLTVDIFTADDNGEGTVTDIDGNVYQTVIIGSLGFPNSNLVNGAGNTLKSCRQVGHSNGGDCDTSEHPRWDSHSTHPGFDEFTLSALPGGTRWSNGIFYFVGSIGSWWIHRHSWDLN